MENKNDFYYYVRQINEHNNRSGNAAIYKACKGSTLLNVKKSEFLEGMLWLIGRSYAASPQRRSYGISSKLKKDQNENSRPVWPVKTENAGNGDFFAEIANYIVNPKKNSKEASDLEKLEGCLEKLSIYEKQSYSFDIMESKENSEDLQRLICVVQSVSLFNRLIKRASERFDCVPENNIHNIIAENSTSGIADQEYVYCKNQISFCSKFLHFFFPNSVFIIDQFSEKGGQILFPKKSSNKYRFISSTYVDEYEPPEDKVLNLSATIKEFKEKTNSNRYIIESIKKEEKIKDELDADLTEINNLESSNTKTEKDNEDVSINSGKADTAPKGYFERYLIHCVNSYILCYLLKTKGVEPVISFPRLSDSVFMRIKTKKEQHDSVKEKRNKIKELYGI